MITMDMIGRIRRLHSRGKKSEREISRMTGLSRNTIAKWLKAPLDGEPKYRRSEQPGKLTAFHEVELVRRANRHEAVCSRRDFTRAVRRCLIFLSTRQNSS